MNGEKQSSGRDRNEKPDNAAGLKGPGLAPYDGMKFFGGLVFFAPVALIVRTQYGIIERRFFCCKCCFPACFGNCSALLALFDTLWYVKIKNHTRGR